MFKRKLGESGSCYGELGNRCSNFLKFIIDFPNFKWLYQPFNTVDQFGKRSQGCNVLLGNLKVWKKLYLWAILSTPRLGEWGSRFSNTNISTNLKPKSNGSKRSVRAYAKPVYAKTPENPPHCHVPLTSYCIAKVLYSTNYQNLLPYSVKSVNFGSNKTIHR